MSAPEPPLTEVFAQAMAQLVPDSAAQIGIALSGGGDSVALMALSVEWAKDRDINLTALTFDHALRDGSDTEAAEAGRIAAALGVPHHVARWSGWDGQGNMQSVARDARFTALAAWGREQGLDAICLGHTKDDLAETFLMRLARGSGVDGLSAMSAQTTRHGIRFLRPMLGLHRDDLRDHLRSHGLNWIEDPSNEDESFDRVAIRKAHDALAELGLTTDRLTETATAMQRARTALGVRAAEVGRFTMRMDLADVVLDLPTFAPVEEETQLRLLAHAVQWVSGASYRPRLKSLVSAQAQVLSGSAATLSGCHLSLSRDQIRVTREYAALTDTEVPVVQTWDNRWQIEGDFPDGATVRALGPEGAALIERDGDRPPHTSLLSLPSVWLQGELLAVPHLLWGKTCRIMRQPSAEGLFTSLIPH